MILSIIRKLYNKIKFRLNTITSHKSLSIADMAEIIEKSRNNDDGTVFSHVPPLMDGKEEYVAYYFSAVHDDDYRIFKHFIDPKETVIDIGANAGYSATSIWAAGGMIGIISFEPITAYERNFKIIAQKTQFSFDYRMYGLSDKKGVMQFYTPCINGIGLSAYTLVNITALHSKLATQCYNHSVRMRLKEYFPIKEFFFYRFQAPVSTLDTVLNEEEFSVSTNRIAAIKIDAEGHDGVILKGAYLTVKKHCPLIMMEHSDQGTFKLLYEVDYIQAYRHGKTLSLKEDGRENKCNTFFVHKSKLGHYKEIGLFDSSCI